MREIFIHSLNSNLYDAAYAPKETALTITVTSNSITVRLLGLSDEGRFNPIPSATVHIYELQEKTTWKLIGDYVTDANGTISIDRVNTAEWYKAVFDGTEDYFPAVTYTQLQAQPPPEQQPPTQPQVQQITAPCAPWLWLLLLLLALSEGKEKVIQA